MPPTTDEIVDIPPNRLRYFGGPGKMLLPCPATVARVIKQVPASQVITTDLLRQTLTEEFEVQGTCPVTTRQALNLLARDPHPQVAYWRVVNANGGLNSRYPGGTQGQAALLRQEGVPVDTSGKAPRVSQFRERLVRFK